MMLIYLSYCIGCIVGATVTIGLTEYISNKPCINNFVRLTMVIIFLSLSTIITKLLLKLGGF
jgi:hypothetical protein